MFRYDMINALCVYVLKLMGKVLIVTSLIGIVTQIESSNNN